MEASSETAPIAYTLDFTSVMPDAGGVGVVARGVAEGLERHGHQFEIVVTERSQQAWRDALPDLHPRIRAVTTSLDPQSGWQVQLRRILPRWPITHKLIGLVRRVRSRSTQQALGSTIAWQPFHRVPLAAERGVVTVHDLRVFEPELAAPVDQRIITDNVAKALAVVCSWPHPYRSLIERFPDARDKTFKIPLPVLNPGQVTARSTPPADRLRLLFPGFVTPHKNHEVVVRALARLPHATAVFTGSEDGATGDQLRTLADSLGVADRIEWHGFVSAAELEEQYTQADLLVMPSRWEAASGPVYEAIARELPFVAADIAPIRAQAEELGLEGQLFEWSSPESLTSVIQHTVATYDERVAEIRAVADQVRSWTWDDCAREYARVMDWAAGRGPRPDDLMIGAAR